MKLQWADRALLDLEDLLGYIAQDSPDAARRLYAKAFRKTSSLVRFPDLGAVSREVGEPFREVLVKPLRILYLREEDSLTVVAVFREEADLR
ncbi:MAG: type II toxin-antitoxin system RelE/ParE family toxin [Holophaga sp.]|nr:type II toxin-antitoxin system RelE/ParE family toxin [Holophaga sp.]